MAKLNAADRKALPQNAFAVPSKAPGSGSYPIEDKAHARNALARSAGKPVAGQVKAAVAQKFPGQVKAAVAQKFPGIGAKVQGRPGESMDSMADRIHPVRK